jgi:hypothetical protein
VVISKRYSHIYIYPPDKHTSFLKELVKPHYDDVSLLESLDSEFLQEKSDSLLLIFNILPDDDITDICISYYRQQKPTDFIIDLTGQLFIKQEYFVHMTTSDTSLDVSIDCIEIGINSSYLQLNHPNEELTKFNADLNSYYSLLLRYAEEYESE